MNKWMQSFSLSALALMMNACGGGSNNISENPTTASSTGAGCTYASSSSCFPFAMEYPIAGIQYTCSSDSVNTFTTQLDDNVVTGGCTKGDTVTFFLKASDNYKVSLGKVSLSDLGVVSTDTNPVHLTLLDMAAGLTGSSATALATTDSTANVALSLVKIFQAIGVQKTASNILGDIQPIELDSTSLTGLSNITANVDVTALQNGSYASILSPWIDTTAVSDAQALSLLKMANNITAGAIYQADPPVLIAATAGLLGYSDATSPETLLGTFFLMSDRQGFTHGYGVQWRGTPTTSSTTIAGALTLITASNPAFMYADAQANWISPLNRRLATVDKFALINSSGESLYINQGRLINDYAVAGFDTFYKYLTGSSTVVSSDLAKWTMTSGSNTFTGGVDFVKAYPISYLDRRVFMSEKTVASGANYYFPLYATLTFKFSDTTLSNVKLGIVIDENGDIRTDIKSSATATDMSGECATADATLAQPVDSNGVTQYRIGTVSATNYQPTQLDLSVVVRMILSGTQFGVLDGTFIGVASSALAGDSTSAVNENGAKINLYNLLKSSGSTLGNINLTNYSDGTAAWVNIFNQYKSVYIQANDSYTATTAEKDQIKRLVGTVGIQLASCYTVKTKS